MDTKSLNTLEFPKILDQVAQHTAFSASTAQVRALRPTNNADLAKRRQTRTSEACRLLSEYADVSVGGARDVRSHAQLAARGGVLGAEEMVTVKGTLISGRDLFRFFQKLPLDLPNLTAISEFLVPPNGLIEAISNILDDKGEIRNNASEKLNAIRSDLKNTNERVINKLNQFINTSSNTRMLQEKIITKRQNRYVVPLKAEYKSRVKCVVQDQSASGATLFVEPMSIVDINNDCIRLAKGEKEEIQRIMAELSKRVGENVLKIGEIVRNLALLDFTFACAKYAFSIGAVEPILIPLPKNSNEVLDPILRLMKARHPLLDQDAVVPIDITLEKGTHALVITGPNTGGKTVSLKTTGLLVLMALSGLHIPAESGSEICIFKNVYADIGDEQSIEQSLSTFSGHIINIVRILKRTNSKTLVLFDELGAGTDPQEGSALARGILSFLIRRQVPALIATHYPELKTFAHSADGVLNASVEFDAKSLKPTYRLMIGIPGRSNALAIAKRLGISDEILQDAHNMIDPENLQADELLDEIHNQLENTRKENAMAEMLRAELETERQELISRLEDIENERLEIIEETREEARMELNNIYAEINAIRRQSTTPNKTSLFKKKLRKQVDAAKEKLDEPLEKQRLESQQHRPLKINDRVYVRRLNTDGIVSAIGDEEIEVQIGKMRVKVDLRDIERSKNNAPTLILPDIDKNKKDTKNELFHPSPGTELQLLGMRAEDALIALDRYLVEAHAAGLPFVRIVHGKGTGKLRQVVREMLGNTSLVTRWERAMENEGGEGVTNAFLEN